jgi:hypothetical protein
MLAYYTLCVKNLKWKYALGVLSNIVTLPTFSFFKNCNIFISLQVIQNRRTKQNLRGFTCKLARKYLESLVNKTQQRPTEIIRIEI